MFDASCLIDCVNKNPSSYQCHARIRHWRVSDTWSVEEVVCELTALSGVKWLVYLLRWLPRFSRRRCQSHGRTRAPPRWDPRKWMGRCRLSHPGTLRDQKIKNEIDKSTLTHCAFSFICVCEWLWIRGRWGNDCFQRVFIRNPALLTILLQFLCVLQLRAGALPPETRPKAFTVWSRTTFAPNERATSCALCGTVRHWFHTTAREFWITGTMSVAARRLPHFPPQT